MPGFPKTERYEVIRRLGAGGMGDVFEARDRATDLRVALKTLRHFSGAGLYRFKQEFRSLQTLRHDNLVRIGELVGSDDAWFFTMELIEGVDFVAHVRPRANAAQANEVAEAHTLEDVGSSAALSAAGHAMAREALDEARLRAGLLQLGEGLRALHSAGKVHRDIKPSNVLVDRNGRVVLLDFGLIADADLPQAVTGGHVVGTPAYMAPEQGSGGVAGPPADWYAFGVLLYEALRGTVPFRGSPVEILRQKCEATPPALAADTPPDLAALCMRLLAVDPADRAGESEVFDVLSRTPLAAPSVARTREPSLVGRDRELGLCLEAYEHSRAHGVACVHISGESGIGKSALLERLQTTLIAQSAIVLIGRCYERESVPFKGADSVIDALARYLNSLPPAEQAALLPRDVGLLAQVFPVLETVPEIARAPWSRHADRDPVALRDRVGPLLRELLGRITDRDPLAVAIDDHQWSDEPSDRLLAEVLDGPDAPAMLVVLTSRNPTPPAFLPEVTHIQLGPLAPDDARRLARSALREAGTGAAGAAGIAVDARGHPLYIRELCQYVASHREREGEHVLLEDAIRARAAALAPDARTVLELIAVAGEPLPRDVLGAAASMSPEAFAAGAATLVAERLAREDRSGDGPAIVVYHDRIRECVIAGLSSERETQLHRDLAAALLGNDVGQRRPELLLRQLLAAGDRERAAATAVVAAERAAQSLAFELSAALYRQAIDLGAADAAVLHVRLADALAQAGRAAEAGELYANASVDATGVERERLRRLAVEYYLKSGHLEEGTELLAAKARELGEPYPSTRRRALLRFVALRVALWLRGYRFRARPEAEVSEGVLARVDTCANVAVPLAVIDMPRSLYYQVKWLLLALRSGEPGRVAHALFMESAFLAIAGRRGLARGQALFGRARELVPDANEPFIRAFGAAIEGFISLYAGDFRVSLRQVIDAETLWDEVGTDKTFERGVTRIFRLLNLRWTGELAELGRVARGYLREARDRGDRYAEASIMGVSCPALLAAGKPADAQLDLPAIGWVPAGDDYHVQHWYELSATAEAALYEGTVPTELATLERGFARLDESGLAKYVVMIRTESVWLRARVALAGGDDAQRMRRVSRAARTLRQEKLTYASSLAALLEATLAWRTGAREEAITGLRDAARLADEASIAHVAAVARARLADLVAEAAEDGLRDRADAWMRAQGIAAPDRILELYAPGW